MVAIVSPQAQFVPEDGKRPLEKRGVKMSVLG